MCGHCCVLVVPLHARRGLSKVAVLRAFVEPRVAPSWCARVDGNRRKGAAVEAVLRVSRLALPFAVFLEYVKVVGPGTVCVPGPTVKVVVAVSYSPTPSQVQYHRRLRA